MSSINDALKRARQMAGTSNVIVPPPPQGLFIPKKRSKAPRILGGIIIVSLAVALVWYVLGSQVSTTEPASSKKPVKQTPAKVADVAPKIKKTKDPEPGPVKSMAASTTPEKVAAKSAQAASATQPAAKPMEPAPIPVKAKSAPAAQKVPGAVKTQPESPAAQEMKPAEEVQKAAAHEPRIVASEPARTTEPSPVVQRKPEEVTKPASVSRLKMPVSTRKKTEASEAAPTVPVKKQPEEINSGSSAQLEPRLQKLISEYRRAIELDPKNALAYLKLGNIFFFEMNDLNQARRMYTKVLEIDPGHKLGHNNLGVIFLKQNSFNRAEAEFNTALKIDPSYTDAQYNKACLSARKGEKNEAMARLLRAAQLDPAVPRWAAGDDDLSFLKDMPEFERFIRQPETANTKDE